MQVTKRYYFPFFAGIALMVYTAQQLALPLPRLINNYGNDLLCMPIVLEICQYAIRYVKNNKQGIIPVKLGLMLTLFYALYFEWLLPRYNDRYTADGLDVLCYFLGLLFFMWMERVPINRPMKSP